MMKENKNKHKKDLDVEATTVNEKAKIKVGKKLAEDNPVDKELDALSSKLNELQAEKDSLAEQNADYEEMIKRQQAEFDNYRKRSTEERSQLLRYAPENLLKDFLTIYDHFDKAVKVKTDNEELRNYVEGFLLIKDQIQKMLEKHGVKESTAAGDEFNPNLHQAIQTEDEGGSEERVKEVYQKGYFLHDKVIRDSMVKIHKTDDFKSAGVDLKEESEESEPNLEETDAEDIDVQEK